MFSLSFMEEFEGTDPYRARKIIIVFVCYIFLWPMYLGDAVKAHFDNSNKTKNDIEENS